MLSELDRISNSRALHLARRSPITSAVEAVIDGSCPGNIWVDDPASPVAALADTPEGHYLVGNESDEKFHQSVVDFISDTLRPGGRGENWWWFYLRCPTDDWAEAMRSCLPEERTVEKPREFYVCENVKLDWRSQIPDGYELVQADQGLLSCDNLAGIERLRSWARNNFGSLEGFLAHGFAFCLLHAGQIVSLCCSDNAAQGRCEVGVSTEKNHRRQGFGSLTVAAAVDWALSNGFGKVGWHCLEFNLASSATAHKVGFRKVIDYSAFLICMHSIDADLIKGNLCLIRREYDQAAGFFKHALYQEQTSSYLLARQEDRVRYAFQAACAHALAGVQNPDTELLEAAIQEAGYPQGGY